MTHRLLMVIIILSAWIIPSAAQAQIPAAYVSASLTPAVSGVGSAREIPMLLEYTMQDGWYMYWRTPGDSGLAPTYDWSASTNVKDINIEWPAPHRYEQDGMYSFGYKGVAAFPVTVALAEAGKPASVSIDVMMIVCNKICVPQNLTLAADIPAGPAVLTPADKRIKDTIAQLPKKNGGDDAFRLDTAVLGKGSVIVTVYSKDGFDGTDLFVESDAIVMTAKPQMEQDAGNPQAAIFRIDAPQGTDDLTAVLLGKTITVTAVKGDKAVEKNFSF